MVQLLYVLCVLNELKQGRNFKPVFGSRATTCIVTRQLNSGPLKCFHLCLLMAVSIFSLCVCVFSNIQIFV